MIAIDKSIPIPHHGNRTKKYPFDLLEIGDSFFVEDGKFHSLQSSASQKGARDGKKFHARLVDGGVRVWRIA